MDYACHAYANAMQLRTKHLRCYSSRAVTRRRLPLLRSKLTTTGAPPPLCCKYMFQVFQTFQRYIPIVSYGCCKSRSGDVEYVASVLETCRNSLFKMFHVFQTYVASVLIWMLYMFHTYVATVCSKCFICSSLSL
jgi:hypothetical protein